VTALELAGGFGFQFKKQNYGVLTKPRGNVETKSPKSTKRHKDNLTKKMYNATASFQGIHHPENGRRHVSETWEQRSHLNTVYHPYFPTAVGLLTSARRGGLFIFSVAGKHYEEAPLDLTS